MTPEERARKIAEHIPVGFNSIQAMKIEGMIRTAIHKAEQETSERVVEELAPWLKHKQDCNKKYETQIWQKCKCTCGLDAKLREMEA